MPLVYIGMTDVVTGIQSISPRYEPAEVINPDQLLYYLLPSDATNININSLDRRIQTFFDFNMLDLSTVRRDFPNLKIERYFIETSPGRYIPDTNEILTQTIANPQQQSTFNTIRSEFLNSTIGEDLIKSQLITRNHVLSPLFQGWDEDSVDLFFALTEITSIDSYEQLADSLQRLDSLWQSITDNRQFNNRIFKDLILSGQLNIIAQPIYNSSLFVEAYLNLNSDLNLDSIHEFTYRSLALVLKGLFINDFVVFAADSSNISAGNLKEFIINGLKTILDHINNPETSSREREQAISNFNLIYQRIKDFRFNYLPCSEIFSEYCLTLDKLQDHKFSADRGYFIEYPVDPVINEPQETEPEIIEESFRLSTLSNNFSFDAENSYLSNDINTRIIIYDLKNVLDYSSFPAENISIFYPLDEQLEGIFLQLNTNIGSNNYHLYLKADNILKIVYISSDLNSNQNLVKIKGYNEQLSGLPADSDLQKQYIDFISVFLGLVSDPVYENEQ